MCGKRLRMSYRLSVLFLVLFFSPLSSFCYAEVKLTDKEAEQMLSEIQESKEELNQVNTELEESKKESQELKTELEDVKNTYNEQKTSYETQLNEAEKKNDGLKTAVTITSTTTGIFLILMIVFIIL